ncbi:uncharacterized protein [Montipora foliosa]|uniref:uncharacterized protein n=1 Tax=Montipora foliosa TaxID=591990 RepID=UPI0035F21B89
MSNGVSTLTGDLLSKIKADEVVGLPAIDIANVINKAFLEPLDDYNLATPLPSLPLEDNSTFPVVSEERIFKLLSHLNNLAKASGPDGISNWILKEHADLLALPVTTIISKSFQEQQLPNRWKCADVTPLPKKQPVEDLKKDLRLISLTPCLSNVAEEIILCDFVKPAALKVLDTDKCGAVPKSSTTTALLSNLIDHSLLDSKL